MNQWESGLYTLTQFHFLRPLWLLMLIPLGVIFYLRWKSENKPRWTEHFPEHLHQVLTINDQGWNKRLPLNILVISLILVIFVCAGPSWQREASPFGEDNASLMIILDSSKTMMQTDVAPNRLERAKHKIMDLLQARSGGKTGLMVYDGSAHVAMPLTQDNAVFLPYLAAIDPSVIPMSGKWTQSILTLLEQNIAPNVGNSVLLITDGVDAESMSALSQYFRDQPYQLLILMAGNPDVMSDFPVDIDSLTQLASSSHTRIIRMSIDDNDIQTITRQVENFLQFNNESSMPWQDGGYILLWPIALLTLFWFRKGWLVQWSIVLLLSMPVFHVNHALATSYENTGTDANDTSAIENSEPPSHNELSVWDKITQQWMDLWLTGDQQGQYYFNQGEYVKAGKRYQDPISKGIAYYYAKEYKLAHTAFLQANSLLGRYYAASALARQREYIAARNMLQALLKELDLSEESQHDEFKTKVQQNLSLMLSLISEINQASESQASSMDALETSIELPDDQPQTADGADEEVSKDKMLKQTLTAEQLLSDPALAEVWLKKVEANPKSFLRTKFQLQYNLLQSQPESSHIPSSFSLEKEVE